MLKDCWKRKLTANCNSSGFHVLCCYNCVFAKLGEVDEYSTKELADFLVDQEDSPLVENAQIAKSSEDSPTSLSYQKEGGKEELQKG